MIRLSNLRNGQQVVSGLVHPAFEDVCLYNRAHDVIMNQPVLTPDITFTRASGAYTFVNQVLTLFPTNAPRFGSLTMSGLNTGLIIEGARTNECQESEGINLWEANSTGNITATSTSDTNLGTVWILNEGTANSTHYIQSNVGTTDAINGEVRSHSMYLKAGTATKIRVSDKNGFWGNFDRTIDVDLVAKTAVVDIWSSATNPVLTELTGGWFQLTYNVTESGSTAFRCVSFQMVNDVFSLAGLTYVGTSKTFYVAKPQLEIAAFPSSYISTGTGAASVTRAADVCSITGLSTKPWFNSAEGTIVCEWLTSMAVTGFNRTFWLGENSATLEGIYTGAQFGTVQFIASDHSGVAQAILVPGSVTWAANTPFRLAGAYKVNDFAASLNGSAVDTDTSGTTLTGATDRLVIGAAGSGANSLFGVIKSLKYYPKRLSNDILKRLSA